jgi:hypothetical protein
LIKLASPSLPHSTGGSTSGVASSRHELSAYSTNKKSEESDKSEKATTKISSNFYACELILLLLIRKEKTLKENFTFE